MAKPGVGANHIQPPPPLPPGVYFIPTKEECLRLLNRSIAGDSALPDAPGYIFHANVYGESPDALRQRYPPASTREGDHTWWFLSETRFQSPTSRTKRADRRVGRLGTLGYWRLEQGKKKLDADGLKNCFAFYTGPDRIRDKTAWLMQEFTSAKDDGAGKLGVPALYRVYVTPHATDDQLRDIYGEGGVKVGPDGKKKPVRAMVPEEYFDAIAKLLPQGQGSVRGENVQLPQAPRPPPPPPAYLGQYQQQQEQYLEQYYHQQQHEQYQQQQEPFFGVAPPLPPPASPDLPNEVAADASLDNLSMSMAEFTGMLNVQPAVMANEEQPPEILKEEEPNWKSLGDIVDDGEFASFNRGG